MAPVHRYDYDMAKAPSFSEVWAKKKKPLFLYGNEPVLKSYKQRKNGWVVMTKTRTYTLGEKPTIKILFR